MKRRSVTAIGETEMEVLHHVWELGRATVADVRSRILAERSIAYTTVMTVMKNLADKGYLDYEVDGNTYVYFPARKAEDVRHSLLKSLMSKVFKGSPAALLQTLVRDEDLSDEQRRQIIDLIKNLEEDGDERA